MKLPGRTALALAAADIAFIHFNGDAATERTAAEIAAPERRASHAV